jgi:hypothetical protein
MLTFLQAARNAGISPVELIKEPEAAALYTLVYLKNHGLEVRSYFKIGGSIAKR